MKEINNSFRFLMLVAFNSFLLVHMVSACAEVNNTIKTYIQFVDPEVQEKFIEELEAINVKYRIDEGGFVWFSLKDKEKVDQIKNMIIEKEFNVSAITFPEDKYVRLFKSKLDNLGVDYRIHMRSGKEYISWDRADDGVAKNAVKYIEAIIHKDNIQKFIESRVNSEGKAEE